MTRSYAAVVLAGGAAGRLGGVDKPALRIGGRSLLDRVLAACAAADGTVVVGPRRPTARPVRWTREQPPGGGPLPALDAGLAALADGVAAPGAATPGTAGPGGRRYRGPEAVLVLAADLPFLTADTVRMLVDTLTAAAGGSRGAAGGADGEADGQAEAEGVMLTDGGGRDQPLAAVYRIEPLRRELALLRAEHASLTGLPLRMLTGELDLRRIADPTGSASFDCDTWEDVAAARARQDNASEG